MRNHGVPTETDALVYPQERAYADDPPGYVYCIFVSSASGRRDMRFGLHCVTAHRLSYALLRIPMGRMFGERFRSVVDWLDDYSVATWISVLAIMLRLSTA
jgi:hypothetical protein